MDIIHFSLLIEKNQVLQITAIHKEALRLTYPIFKPTKQKLV
jgi:hypothetical protein